MTLLTGKDLSDFTTIDDGEYYIENCTGLPNGQSVGYFKQLKYNDGTDDIFVYQEFRGLRNYGDKKMSVYERFAYPKEYSLGLNAYGIDWVKRVPTAYLKDNG